MYIFVFYFVLGVSDPLTTWNQGALYLLKYSLEVGEYIAHLTITETTLTKTQKNEITLHVSKPHI